MTAVAFDIKSPAAFQKSAAWAASFMPSVSVLPLWFKDQARLNENGFKVQFRDLW